MTFGKIIIERGEKVITETPNIKQSTFHVAKCGSGYGPYLRICKENASGPFEIETFYQLRNTHPK